MTDRLQRGPTGLHPASLWRSGPPGFLDGLAQPELLVLTQDGGNQLILSAFRTAIDGLTQIGSLQSPPAVPGRWECHAARSAWDRLQRLRLCSPGGWPAERLCHAGRRTLSRSHADDDQWRRRHMHCFVRPVDRPGGLQCNGGPADGTMEPRALLHSAIKRRQLWRGVRPPPSSAGARHVLQRPFRNTSLAHRPRATGSAERGRGTIATKSPDRSFGPRLAGLRRGGDRRCRRRHHHPERIRNRLFR